jgi:1,4-alpha-glucan branching enzyme
VDAIVGGYHGKPYDVLGPHVTTVKGKEALVVRAFRPLDDAVFVVETATGKRTAMPRIHPAGFFEAVFARRKAPFAYRLVVADPAGNEYELEDPYRFGEFFLTEFDIYLHGEGNFYDVYEKLGAHFRTVDGVEGVNFATWAPNAERVSVIGEFNAWDDRVHAMQRRSESGIWEVFIPNLTEGTHYKLAVKSRFLGYKVDKADPFGFFAEVRPTTDSRIWDIDKHTWNDAEWMEQRPQRQALDKPMSIYEVHPGSWKRSPEDNGFPHLSRPGASACGVRQGVGLHPHRTAAHHRTPLRRFLGLSGDRLLCADQPLRHARRLHVLCGLLPPARHRRPAGLGARALPARRARPGLSSTAPISTNMPTRARASIATGAPRSSTLAATRCATS